MTNPPQPSRLRYSLRGLFAIVTVAAIGSAALANPTDLWASVVFSGTLGLLVVALLVAVARRSAGAIGFALCGGAYLGLILAPGAATNIVPNLVTSKVLVEIEPRQRTAVTGTFQPASTPNVSGNIVWAYTLAGASQGLQNWQATPFQRIGHSLFALLFAIVGSVVARWLYGGRDEP